MKTANSVVLPGLAGAGVIAVAVLLIGMQGSLNKESNLLTDEEKEILSHMSIVFLDDGFGNLVNKTIRISGVNVQIVNGTGTTDGAVNGVGNLIVGYNELGNHFGDDRTGSHNIVGGSQSSFSSYGGFVSGISNTTSGVYSSVCGGSWNIASGEASSVTAGWSNEATGRWSTVGGGQDSFATGDYSTVSGGWTNFANGEKSSISGGCFGTADGSCSSITGGIDNLASSDNSSVGGGGKNIASGYASSVTGGRSNTAIGDYSSVSGGGADTLADGNVAMGDSDRASGATPARDYRGATTGVPRLNELQSVESGGPSADAPAQRGLLFCSWGMGRGAGLRP